MPAAENKDIQTSDETRSFLTAKLTWSTSAAVRSNARRWSLVGKGPSA